MGKGADPELERRRLDRPGCPGGGRDRAAGRGGAGQRRRRGLHLRQPVQAARRRPGAAAGAPRHRLGARQLSDRPVRRAGPGGFPGRAAHDPACGTRRRHGRDRRRHRGGHVEPRQLPDRRDARHGGRHPRGAGTGRARAVGPGAFGRGDAGRPRGGGRRFRRGLRLQVPQRRTRRARFPIRGAPPARGAALADHGMAGPRGAFRVRGRVPPGARPGAGNRRHAADPQPRGARNWGGPGA